MAHCRPVQRYETGLEAGQPAGCHFQAFIQPPTQGLTIHGSAHALLWWAEGQEVVE